ncbi:MAG: CRISPR-associated endoribonuclease Cas6 [Chloroflexi bacterium]|nr:CRISPR-associated endoribonuclease Cas6 [Chloroflexota bacterium]
MTPSPDLYALVIRLIAKKSGTLRATVGHLAHAAFLDILHQVDPAVSQAIHDINGRKPFTISPLHGYGHGRHGKLHIKSGQEGWLRVTLLDPALFHTFISHFLQGNARPAIRLDNNEFHISEILSSPGSHPLAGYDSLQNLRAKWEQTTKLPDCQTIRLHFRTPTAFSLKNGRRRHMHILPDPPLVFGQLASYWDTLTGSDTKEAVREFAAFDVVVARHNIKSHMNQYRRGKQVGFAGRVTFEILDKDNDGMIQHINRLADLAFFTGVGSKTTMGMGQIIRQP